MIFKCIFKHQFGLARLDESGVAWKQCVDCTHMEQMRVSISPERGQAESMAVRRAQAIALLGDRWVGRPSNQKAIGDQTDRAA